MSEEDKLYILIYRSNYDVYKKVYATFSFEWAKLRLKDENEKNALTSAENIPHRPQKIQKMRTFAPVFFTLNGKIQNI